MKLSRIEYWVLSALVVLGLINALMLFVHRVMTNGDNLDYLFIAGRILGGNFGEPFQWRFPVGYPFLLAAFAALKGIAIGTNPLTLASGDLYLFKLLGVAMAPLAVLAVWWWCRGLTRDWRIPMLISGLFATTQHIAPLYSTLGSEPAFLVLSLVALGSWERGMNAVASHQWRYVGFAFAATLLAFLFRQIALAIPVAVLFASAWMVPSYGWKQVRLPLVLAGVLLSLCLGIMALSSGSHVEQLAGSGSPTESNMIQAKLELLSANLVAYRMVVPVILLPKVFGGEGLLALVGLLWLAVPLALGLYILFFAGLIKAAGMRGPGQMSVVYLLVSMGILLVWPYRDWRFFMPLLPVLWWVVLSSGRCLPLAWSGRIQRIALPALVGLMCWQMIANGYAGVKNVRLMWDMRQEPAWHPDRYERTGEVDFADHLACGLWLAEHAESHAVVFAEKAKFIELSSGHRVNYLGHQVEQFLTPEYVWAENPVYVVVDRFPLTAGYGQPKVAFLAAVGQSMAPQFDVVFEAPHGARIYQRQVCPERRPDPSGRSRSP